ncbi:uncharacterized protein LOC128212150 isoform X1 [Mya arenaria]|uniref:uncharacterized protein LOC128212150 isoform X1 n=1 Tax=Mya arenaria TaxID=6604 RepID=UPI0022E0045A|nr:uncharacterized protein LOC128212150 isoform X1 [Mya arenaria]
MWSASNFCSFISTWTCDHDPSFISTYTTCRHTDEWGGDPDPTVDEGHLLSRSQSLTFTQEPSRHAHLELTCALRPSYNFSIIGVEIISEVHLVECYSSVDGYLKSCKGRKLEQTDEGNSSGETAAAYLVSVKFDQPVNDLNIKFMGTQPRSEVRCFRLDVKLLQEDMSGGQSRPEGQVDMARVRGYLHEMGDSLPSQATQLMESVEQFQQTQMSGMGQMSSALGMMAGDNSSILSNLLAMATARSHNLSQNSSASTAAINTSQDLESQNHKPSPLEAMLMKVREGEGQGEPRVEGQDGMFAMLQNICGKVSELRVKDAQEENKVDADSLSSQDSGTPPASQPDASGQTKKDIEDTVAILIGESESRLKQYIDDRFSAMEKRLMDKMESIVMLLDS